MPAQSSAPKPLSDIALQVAECYAVVYPESPARTKAMQWLNIARRAVSDTKGLKSAEVSAAIEELVAAGLLAPPVEARRGVAARGPRALPGTITRLCESSHKRGFASIILRQLTETNYMPSYQRAGGDYIPEYLYEQHARLALISGSFERYSHLPFPQDNWRWLAEQSAKSYLEQLPMPFKRQACQHNLAFLIHYLQPFNGFADTCDEVDPEGTHSILRARGLVFQGQFDEALKIVDHLQKTVTNDKPCLLECEAIRALIATLRGDDEHALKHIQATIEIERGSSRKRILYPNTFCFSVSLLSLVRLGTAESRALFTSLTEARTKLKMESDLDWPLRAASNAEKPTTQLSARFLNDAPCLTSAIYAIVSRWHKDYHFPQGHAGVQGWLDDILIEANHGGYDWVSAEIQSVIEVSQPDETLRNTLIKQRFDNTTAASRHEKLGTSSLTHLVTALEAWEYSLQELEQLARKAKPAKSKSEKPAGTQTRRLIWQIRELRSGRVDVTPFEQSLGKNGHWSGGRKVALKRLREQAHTMSHLITQDVQASATIQKLSYGWEGRTTYETDERTVHKLVGHPCIFDEHGERYDVVEREPVLQLIDIDGRIKLSIEPAFNGNHYDNELDRDNLRVNVTHFTAAHRRIAITVPARGLVVPARARERVQGMLDDLSADIAIQSDSKAVASSVQQGSSTPLLAMEPFGHALRVRLRVEPLPDTATFFDAASGGDVVYVQTNNGTLSVQRDLQEEQLQVDTMVLQSSIMSQHYDGRPYFVIEDNIEALELLEEVQEVGIRCLWPGDIPFRIKARANLGNVNLTLKSAKEWFSASGNITIDDKPLPLAHLLKLMQQQPQSRFIELGKGEFLSLSRTLKQQLDTLQAFSKAERTESDNTRVHPMALLTLAPLLDNASLTCDKSLKDRRKHIKQALNTQAEFPASLQADLRPYQRDGFAWLERLGRIGAGACLADDMGLGKTVQSLALLLSRAGNGPALVVAPTSVVGNWLAEAQRFAPSLNVFSYADHELKRHAILDDLNEFDLIVISYGLLVRDIEHLKKVHWATVVLDEAQAIKNAATQRAKCVKQLQVDFRVVTTGTPVQNNLMDLHSLFSFLNPQLLGSEAAFRKQYLLPITRDNDEHAREQLKTLVSPFLLRRHKRDVLKELPARTELSLNVALSKEEAALYELIRQEGLDSLAQSSEDNKKKRGKDNQENTGQQKIIVLSYLTKLRRLCCNPALIAKDWSGPMSKLDVFSDTLNELISSGHKALVFSQFVDHLKIVEKHLIKQSISYQYLDGSISAKKRSERVSAFQSGDGDVFLISLTAGGTGLNLTAADYVIHLDPWWNPAVEDQASDRAHRIGQRRPVTIIRMVTTGTIEEQIQELHSTKRDLADSVLSGADSPMLDLDTLMKLLRG